MSESKYMNGKIYKIINNEGKCYIGSTIMPLSQRLANHKASYNKYLKNNNSSILTSFEVISLGDYKIELICEFPCLCKKDLHKREGFYIKTMPCVNKIIAGRSKQEYNKDNYTKIQAYKNKKLQCECGDMYTNKHYARHKRTQRHKENMRRKTLEFLNNKEYLNVKFNYTIKM